MAGSMAVKEWNMLSEDCKSFLTNLAWGRGAGAFRLDPFDIFGQA